MALVGLIGLALVVFFFLAMAGITTVESWVGVFFWFGGALMGPLLLLVGGALFALNLRPRSAARAALAGAIVITFWAAWLVGSAVISAVHPSKNPAIDCSIHRGDAVIYCVVVIVAGMVDWAGFRALRLAR